ncbi:hypothetical protein A1OO_14935 [Enterovibrio norvegicus FF-33]|nr:hypothetical protein A1OO_14935 [Enterovibrio norvegicus FF-33]
MKHKADWSVQRESNPHHQLGGGIPTQTKVITNHDHMKIYVHFLSFKTIFQHLIKLKQNLVTDFCAIE